MALYEPGSDIRTTLIWTGAALVIVAVIAYLSI